MFSECTGIRLSVRPSVRVSICVQNTSVCQSAGGGTKLHLVTALVIPEQNKCFQGYTGISLCVHVFIHVSVCVPNTSFCQNAGGGIKSYLVTALFFF